MKRELDIKSYIEGYNTNYIRCFDLVTAILAGYYDEEKYWYYCFISACKYLWNINIGQFNIMNWQNRILELLGLHVREQIFDDETGLHNIIREQIDDKKPLIIYLQHSGRFYHKDYLKKSSGFTGIIISGYDDSRNLTAIQDMYLSKWDLAPFFRGSVFGRLFIKDEMLNEFWRLSIEDFKKKELDLWNKIYYMERIDEGKIIHRTDLIDYFIENHQINYSFIEIIREFGPQTVQKFTKKKSFANQIILRYLRTYDVIIEVLGKCLPQENIAHWNSFTGDWLEEYSGIVIFLSKKAMQDAYISDEKKESLIKKVTEKETEFLNMVVNLRNGQKGSGV